MSCLADYSQTTQLQMLTVTRDELPCVNQKCICHVMLWKWTYARINAPVIPGG